jgi:predicted DNA-binding protein (MmcQ/YjbR family)
MTVDQLRSISLKLPGVTEDIKWETHLCFNVADKMFLITSPDDVPVSASFKVDENKFEEIISRDGFEKQQHLGRYHWVHLDDIKRLTKKEWETYISQSYQLVGSKLSQKKKKQLGLL